MSSDWARFYKEIYEKAVGVFKSRCVVSGRQLLPEHFGCRKETLMSDLRETDNKTERERLGLE